MSSIIIEEDRFPDIVVQFILDNIMSDDMDIDNPEWDVLLSKIENAGLKANLIKYYINTNAVDKSKYKDIKKIFHTKGKVKKSTINIVDKVPSKSKNKEKSSISKVVKKILKIIKSHKRRHYGMPLNESVIDNIIEKVINESIDEIDIN